VGFDDYGFWLVTHQRRLAMPARPRNRDHK
jgi:hypothetical protein